MLLSLTVILPSSIVVIFQLNDTFKNKVVKEHCGVLNKCNMRRSALGRTAMTGLNKIRKDKDITITTKF